MALKKPDIIEHNNPNNAAMDSDFVRGGQRSPVADLAALYELSTKTDQLKEKSTRVFVEEDNTTYLLIDIANVGNSAGWEVDASGGAPDLDNYYTKSQTDFLLEAKMDLDAIPTKLTGIASQRIVGRDTAGTGDSQQLDMPTVKTMLAMTKADVGLPLADNTSDINKPLSTATTNALSTKLDAAEKGSVDGVAELDATGKVPAAQLPGFVDDVLEFADLAAFPATGATNIIYVALDSNLTYRWGGTVYVPLDPTLALGETLSTAYRGDRGKIAYDHSQSPHAPADAQKNSDILKAEIENVLTGDITTHNHDSHYYTKVQIDDIIENLPDPGGSTIFAQDIVVNLAGGKTMGKYTTGQTIPAAGKTFEQVMRLIAIESIAPSASLSSPTTVQFNQTAIANVLNFSKAVLTPGATITTAVLEWRRNNSGSWTTLTSNPADTTYTHNMTDSNFNSQVFNYRYTVTDSNSLVTVATRNITPVAYAAPTISAVSLGLLTRELGDNVTNISGTISRNSSLVPLVSYKVQYQVNGAGSWIDLNVGHSASGPTQAVSDNHTPGGGLVNSTSLVYRVLVVDDYQASISSQVILALGTVVFVIKSTLGYLSATSAILDDILAFGNSLLTNSKARTINSVTAPSGQYTYYTYASSAGSLTNITDGLEAFLGAFTKLADVAGVNSFGANVSYSVYKSNATQAFTNVNLTFA